MSVAVSVKEYSEIAALVVSGPKQVISLSLQPFSDVLLIQVVLIQIYKFL